MSTTKILLENTDNLSDAQLRWANARYKELVKRAGDGEIDIPQLTAEALGDVRNASPMDDLLLRRAKRSLSYDGFDEEAGWASAALDGDDECYLTICQLYRSGKIYLLPR